MRYLPTISLIILLNSCIYQEKSGQTIHDIHHSLRQHFQSEIVELKISVNKDSIQRAEPLVVTFNFPAFEGFNQVAEVNEVEFEYSYGYYLFMDSIYLKNEYVKCGDSGQINITFDSLMETKRSGPLDLTIDYRITLKALNGNSRDTIFSSRRKIYILDSL